MINGTARPSTGSGRGEMVLGSAAGGPRRIDCLRDFALLNVWVVGFVGESIRKLGLTPVIIPAESRG